MNQTRTFLLIAWLSVATLLFMEWNRAPEPAAPPTVGALPTTPVAGPAALPAAEGLPPLETTPASAATATANAAKVGEVIEFGNDVLKLRVDTRGGRLVGAELSQYPIDKSAGSAKVRLLDDSATGFYQADGGLLGAQGEALTSDALFHVEAKSANALTLVWSDPGTGLELRKSWTTTAGSYVVVLDRKVANRGNQAQVGYLYEDLARVAPPPPPSHSGMTDPEAYSFVGAAWYSPQDKFEKRTFDEFVEDGPLGKDVTGGWVALLQHHFLTAWVPDGKTQKRFMLDRSEIAGQAPVHRIRAVSALKLAPNAQLNDQAKLWVGPKLQKPLGQLAPSLKLSVDYGIFTFLAQPVFDWMLSPLHALTGNWGWAIVLTVVFLKLLMYPLSAAQFRSMAKLRSVQPRIEALKERYGEDKQKFQMAMMELYKKEKINPIGGCLPILLTIPVMMALYWVLVESVELRHAPWVGWIQNLTAADPYFILPAINLLVMWLTQKMTPAPGMDPMQKKMMQFMPVVMGVLFAFFPAGLVLYWCTNGILGLAQQWFITRQHGEKPATAN